METTLGIAGNSAYWNLCRIRHRFHAKRHLWDVAKAVYGPGSDMGGRWAKRRRDELDDGRIGALLRALRRHEGHEEARRCIDYVRRNRDRMR